MTGLALAVLIGERVQRAVTEELAVAVHILLHVVSAGEAGGRMRTRTRQAGLITLSTLCSVQVCFWRASDQTLSVVTNISIIPTGGAVIVIRSITFCTVTVTQRTALLLRVCEVALGTVTQTLILMQEVVLFTRTAFASLVTFGATIWTELTYSIFNKVPGRALMHTGVLEMHIVFLTALTNIGSPLTGSTSHGTTVTNIGLWVTPFTLSNTFAVLQVERTKASFAFHTVMCVLTHQTAC